MSSTVSGPADRDGDATPRGRTATDRLSGTVALSSSHSVTRGFDPFAVSSAGAQGMAQSMPDTAMAMGLVNPFDPERRCEAIDRVRRGG